MCLDIPHTPLVAWPHCSLPRPHRLARPLCLGQKQLPYYFQLSMFSSKANLRVRKIYLTRPKGPCEARGPSQHVDATSYPNRIVKDQQEPEASRLGGRTRIEPDAITCNACPESPLATSLILNRCKSLSANNLLRFENIILAAGPASSTRLRKLFFEVYFNPSPEPLEQTSSAIDPLQLQSISQSVRSGGEGTRTPDPLLAKQVLYQKSYTPGVEPHSNRVRSFSQWVYQDSNLGPQLYQSCALAN